MLKISSKLIRCNFVSEILNQNFTPKMGHFGFFQLFKNYAENTLLIDKKIIPQEASYTAQASYTEGSNLQKFAHIVSNLFLNRGTGFYIVKTTFIDYQENFFSFILLFGDLTPS